MKRSGIQRRTPLKARGKRRPSTSEAALHFKVTVCSEPCIGSRIVGHVCAGPLQAMHVIPKQTLRRRGLNHLRYDPLNGVTGCYQIHRRHDNAVEKIPRELLPQRCLDFAAQHNLTDVLDRHWPARSAAA